jgi:hypothetical protein
MVSDSSAVVIFRFVPQHCRAIWLWEPKDWAHLFVLLKVSQAHLEPAVAWGWRPTCSLSVLWHGEACHGLGVQGAKVSTVPGVSSPSSVPPESQLGPWFTELMLSASVSQPPFWIPYVLYFLLWISLSGIKERVWDGVLYWKSEIIYKWRDSFFFYWFISIFQLNQGYIVTHNKVLTIYLI